MKGKMFSRLMSVFLAAVLAVSVLSICAVAEGVPCKACAEEGLDFTGFTATTEFWKISETECARVYQCNNGHKQLMHNADDGSFKYTSTHVAVKNATCESAAICGNCGSTFGAPLEHKVVIDEAVAATCGKVGLTEGKHCELCGKVMVEQKEIPALSHWYAEWEPAGNGKNSAPCKRPGCTYIKTTDCVDWDFKLVPAGAEEAEDFYVCPVCGALSDGERLELVESAVATPVTAWTPEGDLLVRYGTMENGETIICVSFEFDARLVQCYGSTNFTVPAELLEGYRLMLLDEEGNETELEVETIGQKATFMLDFSADAEGVRTPVRMLHLVPLEPEVTEETVEATEAEETASK